MAPKHSWEESDTEGQPQPQEERGEEQGAPRHAWEEPGYVPDDDYSSDSEPEDPLHNPNHAAKEFLEVLMGLYLESVISANRFCVLCYWAQLAGIKAEQVAAYAMKPGIHSGNYQKHLNKELGFDLQRKRLYKVPVPAYPQGGVARGEMSLPLRPPHEILDTDIADEPGLLLKLREKMDDGTLPPAYTEHPVVQASQDDPVVPLALYMDGVQYSQVDSVVGIWLINLLTSVRYMIGLVRKRVLCRCGCRGRDTFQPIMEWVKWSTRCCANGVYPMRRHDGSPFTEEEQHRADRAGSLMRLKAAVVYVKGDWAEFCERFGFPTHSSTMRPCFCCSAYGDALFRPLGVSVVETPWHTNTAADFESAFTRCEVRVVLTNELHGVIRARLHYDKRKHGALGRALSRDVPEAGLRKGDRLEASPSLLDVAKFDDISEFPCEVVFWRRSDESLALFRSLLWDPDIGLNPADSPAIDLLHTLYLGILSSWAKHTLWLLLDSPIWGHEEPSEYERQIVSLRCLKVELFAFYTEYDRQHPGEHCTRLSDLTPKMVGIDGQRKLKTKAMETYYVSLYLLEALQKFAAHLDDVGRATMRSGERLIHFIRMVTAAPMVCDHGHIAEMLDLYKNFMLIAEPLGIYTPKAHLMYHCILRAARQGNPVGYQTFADESLNKTLKRTLRFCHQSNFELLAMLKMERVLARDGIRQRMA